MISILWRIAVVLIAVAALGLAIAARAGVRCYDDSPCMVTDDPGAFAEPRKVPFDVDKFLMAQETLYQSYPNNYTAMMRGSRVIMLMPNDTEMHHVDTSSGYPALFPGGCIAAPPAKCVLHPEQVEPMQEVTPK